MAHFPWTSGGQVQTLDSPNHPANGNWTVHAQGALGTHNAHAEFIFGHLYWGEGGLCDRLLFFPLGHRFLTSWGQKRLLFLRDTGFGDFLSLGHLSLSWHSDFIYSYLPRLTAKQEIASFTWGLSVSGLVVISTPPQPTSRPHSSYLSSECGQASPISSPSDSDKTLCHPPRTNAEVPVPEAQSLYLLCIQRQPKLAHVFQQLPPPTPLWGPTGNSAKIIISNWGFVQSAGKTSPLFRIVRLCYWRLAGRYFSNKHFTYGFHICRSLRFIRPFGLHNKACFFKG